jgi:predicted nucleic acid-binding protein
MLVVTDASPLHYLVLVEAVATLPALFDRLVIPQAVAGELQHAHTPTAVRAWMAAPPSWLDIRATVHTDATLAYLDPGERDAILLAHALRADLLLMDEWEGRRECVRRTRPDRSAHGAGASCGEEGAGVGIPS